MMPRYKFELIAKNVTEKGMPKAEDKETYVGLEHLDTKSLQVTRWGSPVALKGEKLVMHKGDVLFGRRNTYLKRAAIAPHDGLFSAHGMIFRPNEDIVDPVFFPFFILSDAFMDAAIRISVGSLSPTVNWKDLKELEFVLPPIQKQKELAEVLWQVQNVIEAEQVVLDKAVELRNSFYDNTQRVSFFEEHGYNFKMSSVGEEYEVCNSGRKPISQAERTEMHGSYPYWGPTGVLDYINEYRYDGDYVLLGEDGDHFLKYLSWDMTHYVSGKFNVNNHAHVIKESKGNHLKWFYYYFKHRSIEDRLTKQGGGRLKLTKSALMDLPILIPNADVQKELCNQYDQMEDLIAAAKRRIARSKDLLNDLSQVI